MRLNNVRAWIIVLTLIGISLFRRTADAASVGPNGYTNDFSVQPAAADWSSYSIPGANTLINNIAEMDTQVQSLPASTVSLQTVADAGNPPAASAGAANWSSSGLYLATRETGNGATIIMCTLVNNSGSAASGVTLGFTFTKAGGQGDSGEEVPGFRCYYSLTGAASSWTPIPEFSSVAPGNLTATLANLTWGVGGNLYILWADDNGLNVSPDDSQQIDNFSAIAISANQVPVAISSQPQNQTVAERAPASFSVGATGIPAPTFQWYTNNVAITGATNSTYSIASAPVGLNGVQFQAVAANTVTNVNYTATSGVAVLTVNPDIVPPTVIRLIPPAGSTNSSLTSIEVLFSEPVDGVDASDLLINGVPATSIGFGIPGQFVFQFTQPATGTVTVTWAANHGIVDRAGTPNSFASNTWNYVLDPNYAPNFFLINEFLASNNNGLRDEDGDDSDWIEILNPNPTAGNLGGWFLTDDPLNLTKWQFPYRVLDGNGYLLVFASGKNITNLVAGTIHTNFHANFQIKAGGGFLALVDPGTNIVSAFNPYPAQSVNISYGRDRIDPSLTGFFTTPTPRAPNSTTGPSLGPEVTFSVPSGTFVTNVPVSLVLSTPGVTNATIYYSFGTNVPNATTFLYANPLIFSTTTIIRARAFVPGLLPGPIATRGYVGLDNNTNVTRFSSGLPLLILHNYGQGTVPASKAEQFCWIETFENDFGTSSLTNEPSLSSRGIFHVRGSSTAVASTSKSQFFLELRNEDETERKASLLGFPEESDWVLYAPNNFEPALFHNPLAHALYRDMGRYGSRTRFVELYLKDDSGGPGIMNSGDYNGIYVLEEKIKRDPNRVDIARLDPEDVGADVVTGGYLLAIDRTPPGEPVVAVNYTFPNGGATINYVSPNGFDMTNVARAPQIAYIRNYLNAFNADLTGTNYTNVLTTNHYSNYIDVDNWIDLHIHETLTFNVDGMRLSGYFFKDRNKKLGYGPTWDYDRTQGSTDSRDFNPRNWQSTIGDLGTDFFNPQVTAPSVPWWGRLFTAPDFWQAWIDRFQQLRQPGGALSTNNIYGRIDEFVSQIRAAQPREQARWGILPRSGIVIAGGFTNNFGTGLGYQAEVNWEKIWYSNRLDFADHQFLAPPLGTPEGPVGTNNNVITITPAAGLGDQPANTQLILTLDGTDPRLSGGGIRTGPNVLSNTGPISVTVSNSVRIFARSRNPAHVNLTGAHNPAISSPWSGTFIGTYYMSNATPPLRITEIMYHPPPPPAGNTTDADQFEYLEFKNISGTPLDVTGFRLRSGVEFDFPSLVLGAGQTCLVVADINAFSSRYNTNGLIIAGSYTNNPSHNHLGNGGDHLKLEGRFHEPILDFDYSDNWYPTTDGSGFSLQIVNENLPTSAWGLKSSWRPSGQVNGTPGIADPGAITVAVIYINEIMTHTDPPLTDAIELYNPSNADVDVSGWFLTDNFSSPKKYRIPSGTVVANGYLVFYASNSFGGAFNLSSKGEEVYLFSGDANTNLTGFVHGFTFGAQANGVTFGRYITSTGEEHFPTQTTPSLGSTNTGPKVGPIVISEIHYHPPDVITVEGARNDAHDEYVELENITGADQPLYDPNFPTNTWILRNGISYVFPTNVVIPDGGHVVVVSFNPTDPIITARFMASNHVDPGVMLFGPFQGELNNSGNGVELARPDVPQPPNVPDANVVYYILADKVSYSDGPPWPSAADGLGFSIQRVSPTGYGNDPTNWLSAPYTPGNARVGGTLPNITTQPASQFVAQGGNVTLHVAATGSGPFSYAWLFVGNYISGATSSNLTLTSLQPSQAGAYQVLVLNSAGVTASSEANLTVVPPVTITQQPLSQTVRLADLTNPVTANVTFGVTANSFSSLTYQWLYNGTNIPGATGQALTLNNVVPSQTGDYTVIATDPFSSATSAVARLNVFTDNNWRFASLTGDFNNGTNVDIYMQAAGEVYLDDISLIPATGPYAGINVVTNGDFESPLTVGPWLIPASMSNSARTNSIAHSGSFSLHVVAASAGNIILGTVIKHPLPPVGSNVCTLSFWYHTIDSTNFFIRTFPGSSINNVNGFSPKPVDSPPGISAQPNSLTLPAAATASFAVSGYGSEPLAYQWFKDGLPLANGGRISGAATTTLTVSAVQALDMGNYMATVSNALGSSNSTVVSLIVTGAPPQITQQPQSQQVPCHGNVTFTVVANGSAPLSYQWRSNQVDILNETNTSLTLTNVVPAFNGAYSVFVTNPAGSTNSTDANLVVTDPLASLVVLRSGTNLLVSWPVTCTDLQLEETATLSPPSWAPPANATLQQTQTVWTATIPILQSNKFYRLRN